MPKILVCGRGGCGKSTLTAIAANTLSKRGEVFVLDADESNLCLSNMLGIDSEKTLMGYFGGKAEVKKALLSFLKSEGKEKTPMFTTELTFEDLKNFSSWRDNIGFIQTGKIEHGMEGCACPMGAVTREFLKKLKVKDSQYVLVDTEAGIEHFGRGVHEAIDLVWLVIEPSFESISLCEKTIGLISEGKHVKPYKVILNKVNDESRSELEELLLKRKIKVDGFLPFRSEISKANLKGEKLTIEDSNLINSIL
ncbi:cobyrinic acid ac-diamide synthase [Thermodesulfobium narugense DSM 14796]|uniref:Cobyrinic acid ac-diamide synthase n=1 Tax=Thermodesulfobium narugense DSM 14796 TaxID=747365 RepID=M1E6V4_9BACT|nr:cobyrinic acid a,c-diamide synthase [Thermodesulfobium narugense]AEE15001.1 cobyrinic acid ac-diamide synthase [Thermodesulfobium narugense DSM 14796]